MSYNYTIYSFKHSISYSSMFLSIIIYLLCYQFVHSYDLIKKYLSNNTNAKCLDGSIPIYYMRKGFSTGIRKWIIYFEGGSWCFTLFECYKRSFSRRGSSLFDKNSVLDYKDIYLNASYLTNDVLINPMMYNWNTVYIRYCDGTSYTSNMIHEYENKVLYFHGAYNRDETIQQLLQQEHMDISTNIIVSGCSAGGLGVYYGLDKIRSIIHSYQNKTNLAIITGLSDSGFFPNISGTLMENFQSLYYLANMSAGINKRCIDNHINVLSCLYPETLLRYIKTPTFSMQSKYDSWQIASILKSKNIRDINSYGDNFIQIIYKTFQLISKYHGFYIDSCNHHCFSCISLNYYSNNFWIYDNKIIDMDYLSKGLVNPFYAFYLWYNTLLSHNNNNNNNIVINNYYNYYNKSMYKTIPGINWFVQNVSYPKKCLCKLSKPDCCTYIY